MTIDMVNFHPWHALFGGALIGLAAAILLWSSNRLMGISGIIANLVNFSRKEGDSNQWRVAFIVGILLALPLAMLLGMIFPGLISSSEIVVSNNATLAIIAGLLVGVGTRLANGCTSGHGVCGLSRLSIRSLVATGAFMGAGFLTVFIMRHVL